MEERRHQYPLRAETAALFLMAMAVLVVTVVIGMLNGLDLVEFDHNVLMTHVHAGTLGWITLSVFAVGGLMFGASASASDGRSRGLLPWRWITWLAVVTVPIYVIAFWTGNITFRALTSLPVFVAIVGMYAWLLVASRAAAMTTPRLSLVAAFTILVIGAAFGTLIQLQLALGREFVSLAAAGSGHVTAMAFGYLVLVGMGIVEWRLGPHVAALSRAGAAQVGALFIGAILLTIGAMTNIEALVSANLLFQVTAVAIFVVRLGLPVARARWLAPGGTRFFAASGVFVVVDIGILVYLIAQLLSGAYGPMEQDITLMKIPPWLIFALDHVIFIGVMSNAIFGLLFASLDGERRLAWVDHIVFVGMNAGLVGFVLGLAITSATLERIFSPLMGASILLGLLTCAIALLRRRQAGTAELAGP